MTISADGLEYLDEDACFDLAATGAIGRVVLVSGGVAAVFPVNYQLVGRDVVFRTGEGTKLRAARGRAVTFEVDDFDRDSHTGWSVIMVGPMSQCGPAESDRAHALGLYPWAGGHRPYTLKIRPEFVSGRRLI